MRASQVTAAFRSPIGNAGITFFMVGSPSLREAMEIASAMAGRIYDNRVCHLISISISYNHEVENADSTMHFPDRRLPL